MAPSKRPRSEPMQFYRPKDIPPQLLLMLEAEDLEEQEIIDYLQSGKLRERVLDQESIDYRKRRLELFRLHQRLADGGAMIDVDGRLVEADDEATVPPNPPANHPLPLNPAPPLNNVLDNEEADRQWLESQEREASEAIVAAVMVYRDRGVDLADLELIDLSTGRPGDLPAARMTNFTFRRICFAILAVVTAFVCIMLQTFPILDDVEDDTASAVMDPLMFKVLHVRRLDDFARDCPHLDRNQSNSWKDRVLRYLGRPVHDCSDGVVHVPSPPEAGQWMGSNRSWFFSCRPPLSVNKTLSSCYPGWSDIAADACPVTERSCFRGVHDNVISFAEVMEIVRFGANLIARGGDHFDILYDTDHLQRRLPSVVDKLYHILRDDYLIDHPQLRPVAYRVSAVAPMDGDGVPLYGLKAAQTQTIRLLNRTRYVEWVQKSMNHNEMVAEYYYFPSILPSSVYSWLPLTPLKSPVRDTCNLMADMQVDPQFSFLTSVSLSHGAGLDYTGGVSLFVDDDFQARLPIKFRRGLSVDGFKGRVVVSTGGLENRRCRLPTRTGVRATLQVWWDCATDSCTRGNSS